jgi:dolichyl-phosphate beta-glucosyltransferase
VKQPLIRILGSRAINIAVQALLLPGVKDTQCGFKLFSEKAVQEIFPKVKMERWGLDLEVLVLARYLGWKIIEVPVRWVDDPRSRMHPMRDGVAMLRDILKIKRDLVMGKYR